MAQLLEKCMRISCIVAALSVLIATPAIAQQQLPGPPTAETRVKIQLGELLYSLHQLSADNEQLRAQVQNLTRVSQELRDKYEPKTPAEPKQ